MERYWIYVANGILFIGVYVLSRWARRNPDDFWVIVLFRLAVGPRTDVPNMTRHELFRSAASFVTWTLFSLLALEVILLIFFMPTVEPTVTGQVALFAIVLFSGMGGLAALYLFVRGLLRRPNYQPRHIPDGEDETPV